MPDNDEIIRRALAHYERLAEAVERLLDSPEAKLIDPEIRDELSKAYLNVP